jgi:hypothetical protein
MLHRRGILQGGNSMIQALSLVTPRQAVLLTEILQSLIWKALLESDHHAVTLSRYSVPLKIVLRDVEGV